MLACVQACILALRTRNGHVQGSGKQHIGACVNLVSTVTATVLAFPTIGGFYLHGSVEGMLVGIFCTQATQAATFAILASRLDWGNLAVQAANTAAASHVRLRSTFFLQNDAEHVSLKASRPANTCCNGSEVC